ncbi:hypothetical protein YTPLAS18_13350 [Nitrospira sp.]|nr:hypothetical protein YTPLAS18_13350 [Nitrospira sp.]
MPTNSTPAIRVRPRQTLEREIKLSVPPGFRLPGDLGDPIHARSFVSSYHDTMGHRLADQGITLRRRVERGHGVWQLKLPADNGRWELESDGGAAPPASLTDLVYVHVRGEPLQAIARLRTRRVGLCAKGDANSSAEVVVDRVALLEGRRVIRRFDECEIELLQGDPSLLERIEARLREAGAGDHEGRPKLFRALNLSVLVETAPSAGAPVRERVKWAVGGPYRAALTNDPLVRLGTDPEALHDMRVAIRRLRAILRALKAIVVPEWADGIRGELAWIGGALGAARDLDVQIEHFNDELRMLESRDRAPLRTWIRSLIRERVHAHVDLVAQLRSDRYLALVDSLAQACREPLLQDSNHSIEDLAAKEYRRLRRFARTLPDTPSDAELHRLRIKAKRARYAAELVVEHMGKPAQQFVAAMKGLQDVLGAHQDAVVAEARLREYFDRPSGVRAAFAAGRLVERQRQRREQARQQWQHSLDKALKRGKKAWA